MSAMPTPDFSATSRITAWAADFSDFEASAGQLPVAVIDPTDQQDLASDVADRCERRGQHVVRARRVRILVVLA